MAFNSTAAQLSRKLQRVQVDDLISCAICLHHFVDPRVLPCSHTYCLRCIHEVASANSGQFQCPLQDGTIINKRSIDSLPINRVVRDMVELLPTVMDKNDQDREKSATLCDHCDEDEAVAAEFWCGDCSRNLCLKCSTKVHKQSRNATHKPVPINHKPPDPVTCLEHPKKELEFWCESCGTLVCSNCLLFKHKDHKYALIDDIAKEMEAKVRTDLQKVRSSLEQRVKQALPLVDAVVNVEKEKITNAFKSLRKMIDDHERVLQLRLLEIETKNKTLINGYQTQVERQRKGLQDQSEEFERMFSTKDPTKLLQGINELTEGVNKIAEELRRLEPPIGTKPHVEGLDQLQRIREILTPVCIVEQKEEQKRTTPEFSQQKLDCGGRACAACNKCRDWYYTGDSDTFNWIRTYERWTNDDWKRFRNDRIYERFKRRDGATCRYDDLGRYDYLGYGLHGYRDRLGDRGRGRLCVCPDNNRQ